MKAFRIFGEQKYLVACERAAEVIWRKGLLTKGPGLCHGVAGNGYALLNMHRLTNDPKHLYRAIQFAHFLEAPEFAAFLHQPDRPWSLYEGLAGTVCFLIDLLHHESASFPFMGI